MSGQTPSPKTPPTSKPVVTPPSQSGGSGGSGAGGGSGGGTPGKSAIVSGAQTFGEGENRLAPRGPGANAAAQGVMGGARAPRDQGGLEAQVAHDGMAGPNGIKTFNPAMNDGKGGFENAAPTDRANADDKRVSKGVGAGDTREASVQMFRNLNNGLLTMEQLLRLDPGAVARIQPVGKDCSARNILHGACQQSWHVAKHALAESKNVNHQAIMRKLWEYRQWHFEDILKKAQTEVNKDPIGPTGLKAWPSAGSSSLTSDIDVNLKGTATEKAVEVFNRLFKADGWDYESGVVYDVNVYALDFMHAPKGIKEAGSEVTKVGKEGVREGAKTGGFVVTPPPPQRDGEPAAAPGDGAKKLEADTTDQEVWSLLKVRMYMNVSEWEAHKLAITPAAPPDKRDAKLATFVKVELRLKSYQKTLIDKMIEMAGPENAPDAGPADAEKHGVGQVGDVAEKIAHKTKKAGEDEHTVAEDAQMAASNRIYEGKLKLIATLRAKMQKKIASYNGLVTGGDHALAELMQESIHKDLLDLRRMLSEASLFSNEAYITDGAINHTVVGLQMGAPVSQTQTESMNAVNENMGDSLKEIGRHSRTIGEAAYKAGKYMWRMCDAARNMGITNSEIDTLYSVGFDLGNTIKSAGGDVEAIAAKLVKDKLHIEAVADLKALVVKVGQDVTKTYDGRSGGHEQELGSAVTKGKH